MSQEIHTSKAKMWAIQPGGAKTHEVEVQFNPETLKVSFANQVVSPETNTPGSANTQNATPQNNQRTTQFVGRGTTKLAVQLWFDVTSVLPPNKPNLADVRVLTREIIYFLTPPTENADNTRPGTPPLVHFEWGSFHFEGVMETLEESLEFFSDQGLPLRASVSFSLAQQEIVMPTANENPAARRTPGTRPMTQAPAGSSLPNMACQQGQGAAWQTIAQANGIENPRLLQPGQLIDFGAAGRGQNYSNFVRS